MSSTRLKFDLFHGPHIMSNGSGLRFNETPAAFVLQCGSSSSKVTSATAGNHIEFRFENTAASGDCRGIYNRLYLEGGAGGESLRCFTSVGASTGTAHGAHISLNFNDAAAALSGLGAAVRATLHIPERAVTVGTVAAGQSEIYMDGTAHAHSITGLVSCHRFIVDGADATAKAMIKYLFSVVGVGAGTGNMYMNSGTGTLTSGGGIKILVNGVDKWIPLCNAEPS